LKTAIVDGDIICYRCAASCQKTVEGTSVTIEPVEVAIQRVDELMQRILHETAAPDYQVFLTGSNNFRFTHNPEYKANRKDSIKPQWLEQCREHLVVHWKAEVSDGCEADDLMAIAQTRNPENTIICTIDKDLLQVVGDHYNFVNQTFQYVTPLTARFNFYWQFIMGDKADNIKGFDGLMRSTVPKKMEWMVTELQEACLKGEKEAFEWVREQYNDDERLLMNGRCLYMQRHLDELWEFPK
tara:strand:- start:1335 stop:2057 length:723 start_codon:yes stop_codon:yes gene_type:complete